MVSDAPVVIVGAGMAGLTCAVYLKQAGIDALLLEAADGVGGRVRTDLVDGFRLDRGFQILLTAYPEARRLLNYSALDLRSFRSGALIRSSDGSVETGWIKLLNPFQEPTTVLQTLASPVGTFGDKLRILELMRRTHELTIAELFRQTPTTTLAFLEAFGFSERIIDLFFRPFFGGVFLEDALSTSSNFFEFCFRMFFAGDAAVPANGIGAIPEQLAGRLAPGQIRLRTRVSRIDGPTVYLETGETVTARAVVLAVDAEQANRLMGRAHPADLSGESFNHTTCTYFTSPASVMPPPRKLLMLNPKRSSAVHNVAIMSEVAPTYVPDGGTQALISVSTQGLELVNETALTERIRQELVGWFGDGVQQWRHLRTYHLPQALPTYGPNATHQPLRLTDTLYQCGDQTAYPSLNAAMQTGREVAEQLIGGGLGA